MFDYCTKICAMSYHCQVKLGTLININLMRVDRPTFCDLRRFQTLNGMFIYSQSTPGLLAAEICETF